MSNIQQMLEENERSLLLQPLSLFTIAAIFFIFFRRFFKPSKKTLPPSPPKLPIIGNLHQVGSFPHLSFHALAQRHGPLMLLHFGKVPVLVVSSADAAREILRTHDIIFADRPKSTPFEKLVYGSKDVAMSPHGEYWRQVKSICVLHLLSNRRIHSFRNVRAEEVALMIEKIKQFSSSSLPIDLSEVMCTLTNNIVCRVALGRKYNGGEGRNKFRELLGKAVELLGASYVGDYISWLAWVSHFNGLNANLEKVAKKLDDFLEGVLEEHENRMMNTGRDSGAQGEDKKDFVDVLLWVQKENIFGFPIDRVAIKGIILVRTSLFL